MTTGKPPAEKLPLAARKNVRDEYENKRPEFESRLSSLLKAPWTININPLAIYPYASEGSYGHNSPGACIAQYVDDAIGSIKSFVEKTGEDGTYELNSLCTAHVLTLAASSDVSYCGCDILQGMLRILFNPDYLGTNIGDALVELAKAVNDAPQSKDNANKLSFAARHSIKTTYEPEIGEVLSKAQKILANPSLQFDPNFEQNAAAIVASQEPYQDWERSFGDFTLRYFQSLVSQLEYQKFDSDEMLQEGFAEEVSKGLVKVRVVDKIKRSYNEAVLDDGVLCLQTTPKYWGTNINDIAETLMDIL